MVNLTDFDLREFLENQLKKDPRKVFEMIEESQEWADEKVDKLFHKWCELNKVHPGWGVANWNISGDSIYIKQDISYRGCYDTQNITLTSAWLFVDEEEQTRLIEEDVKDKETKKKKIELLNQEYELKRLQEQVAELEIKMKDKQ